MPPESSLTGAQGHWIVDTPIANPMSVYPKYKASRKSWGIDALGTMVVEVRPLLTTGFVGMLTPRGAQVELNNGVVGVGVSIGGDPGCFIVENHLSRFVEGQDIHNIELMWDQMWRATINYGRKGKH